ncbi:MAG: hypothetical protein ABH863_00860 [Candidatus Micrarchaeota archaeon]
MPTKKPKAGVREPSYPEAFVNPFKLQYRQPKMLLIGVLNWIPALFMTILASDFLSRYSFLGGQLAQAIQSSDSSAITEIFPIIADAFFEYVPALFLIGILSLIMFGITLLAYTQIVIAARRSKKPDSVEISLGDSLGVAFSRLLSLISAYCWYVLAILGIIAALVLLIIIGSLLGALGILIAIIAGIGLIFALLIASIAGWLLEAVLIAEGKGGRASVQSAFSIAWKNKLRGTALIIVYFIIYMVLNQIVTQLNAIPIIGIPLSMVAGLPAFAWSAMVAAEFYFILREK